MELHEILEYIKDRYGDNDFYNAVANLDNNNTKNILTEDISDYDLNNIIMSYYLIESEKRKNKNTKNSPELPSTKDIIEKADKLSKTGYNKSGKNLKPGQKSIDYTVEKGQLDDHMSTKKNPENPLDPKAGMIEKPGPETSNMHSELEKAIKNDATSDTAKKSMNSWWDNFKNKFKGLFSSAGSYIKGLNPAAKIAIGTSAGLAVGAGAYALWKKRKQKKYINQSISENYNIENQNMDIIASELLSLSGDEVYNLMESDDECISDLTVSGVIYCINKVLNESYNNEDLYSFYISECKNILNEDVNILSYEKGESYPNERYFSNENMNNLSKFIIEEPYDNVKKLVESSNPIVVKITANILDYIE